MTSKINSFKNENNLLIQRIKKESIECIQSLTTHGLPNLSRTKYKLIKFIWFLLTIASALFSIYFILKTLSEFYEYNVTTEVRLIKSNEPLEFPTISICNKNRFSTNYSVDRLKNLIKSNYNYSFEELFHNQNITKRNLNYFVKSSLVNNESKFLFSDIEMNEREKYTLNMKNSLLHCQFMNQNCNYTDFEWFFNSKYGNCYKFNTNGLKKSYKANQDDGLLILLLLKNPIEIEKLGFDKGLFISIDPNNKETFTDFENLIEISSGYQTNIQIHKSLFQKYPKPYSNCDIHMKDSIDFLKSDNIQLINEIIQANFTYSHSLCMIFCRHKLFNQNNVTCKFKSNSLQVPNVNYCQANKNLSLIIEYENILNENITKSCLNMCPMECETIKYDTDIFITKYPEWFFDYFKYVYENLNKDNDTSIDREDFLILKIFYGSLNYMSYKESPSMSLYGLISNLGGTLGLFLGNSLYLFEIINI